jgi:Mrp family chromosome partitioning ATPase
MKMLSANEIGLLLEHDKRILEASQTNLTSTVLNPECRTLLITGPSTGCGTSTSALSIARQLTLSSAGKVLLVDASPSPKGLTASFKMSGSPGLLDLLASANPEELLPEAVQRHPDLPFDLLPLGMPHSQGKYLLHEQIQRLFHALGHDYRFIVIDGEAVYASSYSLSLAAMVDGVILVVRGEQTRWEVAQAAVQRLRQANANLLGSIFNARRYYTPKWLYRYL